MKAIVLNSDGKLHGTITLADLRDSAFNHDFDLLVNAGDVARQNPPMLAVGDNLEKALTVINKTGEEHIAVVEKIETQVFKGCIHQRDIMIAYNKALLDARHEEHGE